MSEKLAGEVIAISKTLSANDTGETGAHQAGILVPKSVLFFFPHMSTDSKNPRAILRFKDDAGKVWNFNFIYYNNRFFGGTRNEYRLTGMTAFFKEHNLTANDSIILEKTSESQLGIKCQRNSSSNNAEEGILILGSTWKVVNL